MTYGGAWSLSSAQIAKKPHSDNATSRDLEKGTRNLNTVSGLLQVGFNFNACDGLSAEKVEKNIQNPKGGTHPNYDGWHSGSSGVARRSFAVSPNEEHIK